MNFQDYRGKYNISEYGAARVDSKSWGGARQAKQIPPLLRRNDKNTRGTAFSFCCVSLLRSRPFLSLRIYFYRRVR